MKRIKPEFRLAGPDRLYSQRRPDNSKLSSLFRSFGRVNFPLLSGNLVPLILVIGGHSNA